MLRCIVLDVPSEKFSTAVFVVAFWSGNQLKRENVLIIKILRSVIIRTEMIALGPS